MHLFESQSMMEPVETRNSMVKQLSSQTDVQKSLEVFNKDKAGQSKDDDQSLIVANSDSKPKSNSYYSLIVAGSCKAESVNDDNKSQSEALSVKDLNLEIDTGYQEDDNDLNKDLAVFLNNVISPLREKEKILESSAKELKEKLAKVRKGIQQLSEHPSSFENQSVSVASPNNFASTISLNKEIGKKDDLEGSAETRKKEFEDELSRLRQELNKYNKEEQKVLSELEVTKTIRKAHEMEINRGAAILDTSQSNESSFQLLPQRLVFDDCSQKSANGILHSPILNTTPLTNDMKLDLTQDVAQSEEAFNQTENSAYKLPEPKQTDSFAKNQAAVEIYEADRDDYLEFS